MILVSLDFGKNVQERLNKFRTKKKISAEIVLLDDPDADSWINKVDKNWDGAIPATVIYKKDQKEVFNAISNGVDNSEGQLFKLDAPGG